VELNQILYEMAANYKASHNTSISIHLSLTEKLFVVLFARVVVKINRRNVLIIVLFVFFGSTYVVFFLLQQNTEKEVRQSLLFEQEQDQKQAARFIGLNTESDLKMIKATLYGLANSETVQTSPLTSNSTEMLMQQSYAQIDSTIDRLFLINKTGIIVTNIVPPGEDKFLGSNLSKRADWVRETMLTEKPVFSNGYVGLDGKYRVGMTMPIVNSTTNDFEGLFGVLVPVNQFFEHYGNVYDVNSEYLTAYDSNGTLLVTPLAELLGTNVFGNAVQEFVDGNSIYNRIFENAIVKGVPDNGIYDIPAGQFLNTAYPIKIDDKLIYAVAMITPTNSIYSDVNKTIQSSVLETTVVLIAITVAVVFLSILIFSWHNEMKREVLRRTLDLEEANKRLGLLNEQLTAADRAKEEFIAMVSHELRTPLQPIKAFAGMLKKPKFLGDINQKQEKALDSILRNIDALETLVSDVLDVFRIERNKLKLVMVSTRVKEMVNSTVSEFKEVIRSQYSEKDIQLDSDLRIDPKLEILCDPQRIGQVFSNLVKNSIDFVPPKNGRIVVRAEEMIKTMEIDNKNISNLNKTNEKDNEREYNEREIVFTVEDNGPGFPPDKIDLLFRKFYQIDTSIKRKHGGTGLGLVICKGIVESHGGKIWIDKKYSNGASLKFTLPIDKVEEKEKNNT